MNYLLAIESLILFVSLGFMAVYAVLECLDTLKRYRPAFVDGFCDFLSTLRGKAHECPETCSEVAFTCGQMLGLALVCVGTFGVVLLISTFISALIRCL